MRHWLAALALAFLALIPFEARAQVPPEKALATFTVADGLELSLFAAEPMLVNPTSIDVDHRGRVWVCEAVNYRRVNFGRPILRKEGDRIVVLEDTQGAGKADKAHVFYQGKEIIAPLGIAVAPYPDGKGQRVYVCQSPDILVFEDKDGDLKADGPPKKLLTGFRGIDHDHGVHGINIGPDGKLYFTVGDSGVQNLQASDGKGRKFTSNSTDCRAGTVWRCDMDGKNLELIAHNFRNNYECCVDSFGSIFLSDNDDDGNQQTRICYVMPGGNYGYHPRGKGESHWHEEQPGIVHKILRTGFGSPCGICVYEGSLLPKKYHGQLIHADSGPREIRAFHLKPKGAGYDVEKELLVTSKDNWFRASDVCVAPDGSIMIADWYDPGVGGHGMGDWTRGRIYRLTPKGHKGYQIPSYKYNEDDVFEALLSPNLATRYAAGEQIRHTIKDCHKVMEATGATFLGKKGEERAFRQKYVTPRALWISAEKGLWPTLLADRTFGEEQLIALFEATGQQPQDEFRVCFLKALLNTFPDLSNLPEKSRGSVRKAVHNASTVFHRETLLALRNTNPGFATEWIMELAKLYDGKDRFYLNAIGIAVGTDPERRKIILADFEKHFPEWNDKVADLVWELRPPSMMPKLGKMLADPKLSASSRGRIVDILAASDDKSAGKAMLDVLAQDVPAEVRTQVLANLKLYLPGKWKDLRNGRELESAMLKLLEKRDTRVFGLSLMALAERDDYLARVHGYIIDREQPMEVRREAVRTLGSIPSGEAVEKLWKVITLQRSDLVICSEAIQALGVHLSRKADSAESKAALNRLQDVFREEEAPLAWKQAAISALAGSRPGTIWLLGLHEKNQLHKELLPDVARLLRNSPYPDLRNRAMVAFPPPGKLNLQKLPPITALIQRKGNVERGKQLFALSAKNDMQCAKCHTVRGLGGSIGPDLSMIGKKASRENLIESILYPSKAIADQYLNWQITTGKGLVLNGLIVEETPQYVVLRDGNGKDTKIDKKDIDERTRSPKSLMADDIVVYMTEDDLLDITEYMLTLKSASLAVPAWHIIGPFDNGEADAGLDREFPPEKAIDLKATYEGKSGKVGWRVVRPEASGYVDLMKFFAPGSSQIVSYLYQEIESPADQDGVILIGNDDGAKLWINGEQVFKDARHLAAAPGASEVKVKLKKGANKVLLKLNNGDGPHGFYFTVLAEQELKPREVK